MQSTGFVFYDGPSMLDGAPIIGIAVLRSANAKTGDMVQTYILRADAHPVEAIRTGDDASVCGDCPHRGTTCYVDVGKSVAAVFACWARGGYPLIDPRDVGMLSAGRYVRIGSYGDPAAIPLQYWLQLIKHAAGHTGYSHQWKRPEFQGFRDIVMASADSAADMDIARAMGWRTFRVRTAAETLADREIACPASDEAGKRAQCISCRACDGADRPGKASIAIIVHGRGRKAFESARVAV